MSFYRRDFHNFPVDRILSRAPKVLIVEDNEISAESIKKYLIDLEYNVVDEFIVNGKDVVEKVKIYLPDIILMDIELLDDVNGLEAAELLKYEDIETPVIFIADESDIINLNRVIDVGAYGFIPKNDINKTILKSLIQITIARYENEKKLIEQEILYRTLFEKAGDSIFIIKGDGEDQGKIIAANQMAADMHGYTIDDLHRMNIKDLDDKEAAKDVENKLKSIAEGKWIKTELNHVSKDGTVFPLEISAGPITLGGENYVIAFDRDISERKNAENRIKTSLSLLQSTLESTTDGILVISIYGNITTYNKNFLDIWNVPESLIEEGIGKKVLDYLLGLMKYPEKFKDIIRELNSNPESVSCEMIELKDERLLEHYSNLQMLDGKIAGRVWSFRDITQRIVSEKSLLKGEAENKAIVEAFTDIFFKVNSKGNITKWYNSNVGMSVWPEDYISSFFIDKIEDAIKTNQVQKFEYPVTNQTFKVTYFDARIKNIDGNELLVVLHDITEKNILLIDREKAVSDLKQVLNQFIEAISKTVEIRDPYTAGHEQRVSELAVEIAKEMKLSEEQVESVRMASRIHDLGKITLPAEILSKPGKIDDIEFMMIKKHPGKGYDILKQIKFHWPIADIVHQHHEKVNGSGYPMGLEGDEIMLEARIISVADTVEAMTFHRPYREKIGIEAALSELEKKIDVFYDREVVEVCLKLFREKGFRFSLSEMCNLKF